MCLTFSEQLSLLEVNFTRRYARSQSTLEALPQYHQPHAILRVHIKVASPRPKIDPPPIGCYGAHRHERQGPGVS